MKVMAILLRLYDWDWYPQGHSSSFTVYYFKRKEKMTKPRGGGRVYIPCL
jgi:hypothetical protein